MRDPRIDKWRGFFVALMIIYHGLYDLVNLFDWSLDLDRLYYFQQFIAWGFILLSGISQNLSRRPWKNALKILAAGLLVQGVTWAFIPQERILFGILHFLGLAGLMTSLLAPVKKEAGIPWLALGLGLAFGGTRKLAAGRLLGWPLPAAAYGANLYWLGLPGPDFWSADYYPLIPWIFLYWLGWLWGQRIRFQKKEPSHQPLAWMGRHSLLLYLIHQPLLYGLFHLLKV